ncbi:DUF2510 domain-containing protein [Streptomyces sp. NPDC006460]|uniref:DUF2510 domain-containing protein n=2 Tax=Streptomyces TaxID=1883 RepID=UPI0033BBBB4D
MSMTTPPPTPGGVGGPPGWYPDPAMPTVERWWDGTAWTAHTRFSQVTTAMPVAGPAPSARRGRAVALGAAALVLAAAVVATVLVLGGDEDAPVTSGPPAASTGGSPAPATSGTPSATATAEDATRVTDQLNGITLPIVRGWEKPEYRGGDVPTVTTVGDHPCPGAPDQDCRHGTVSSRTATGTAAGTPEAIAREDIPLATVAAFDEDVLGNDLYGGIRSHKEIAARSVAVAGRTGFLVRWQVTTGKGPGGYVQSLVFPSPTGSEAPVVVRFAFDAGPDGPPLAEMDEIAKNILPIGSTTSGGVGTSMSPRS